MKGDQSNDHGKNISSEYGWKQKFITFNSLLSPKKKGNRQYKKFSIFLIALQRDPTFLLTYAT